MKTQLSPSKVQSAWEVLMITIAGITLLISFIYALNFILEFIQQILQLTPSDGISIRS